MKLTFIVVSVALWLAISSLHGQDTDLNISVAEKKCIGFWLEDWNGRDLVQNNDLAKSVAPGLMNFSVNVCFYPRPSMSVSLNITQATNFKAAAEVWGHQLNEKVIRPLAPDDVAYINDFLKRYSAREAVNAATDRDPGGYMMLVVTSHTGDNLTDSKTTHNQTYYFRDEKEWNSEFFKKFIPRFVKGSN